MKSWIRHWLERAGTNERFRDSALYAGYLRLFFPRDADRKRRERNVYRALINRPGFVFDIGANIGQKAIMFAQLGKRVVCVEPDPIAVDVIRRRFRSNPQVHVIHAGVSLSNGVERMYQIDEASCYNTFSRKWMTLLTKADPPRVSPDLSVRAILEIPTISLDDLISTFGTPAYVKIDVEGGELDVVRGLSTAVPLLSFEAILPEFVDETSAILDRLHALDPGAVFNYCLDDPDPELSSERWLSCDEIKDFVRRGRGLLMEIYCRSDLPSNTPVG